VKESKKRSEIIVKSYGRFGLKRPKKRLVKEKFAFFHV
jgi:hypothetical protein